MDVFKQRLEQEYGLSVIITAPSVLYKVKLAYTGEIVDIENPSDFPEPQKIDEVLEPIIDATILLPTKYLGPVIALCQEKRGIQQELTYLNEDRVILKYKLPLNEVASDFYDQLKSLTSGYASLDYEEAGYQAATLVKMDILLNGKAVDALSTIVHEANAQSIGKQLALKLRQVIPRQMFEVAIQAAIGAKVIARETISPLRKNVTAKCYGGDITRKRKLLEKQKEGKKKMKQVGNVEVPQEAFLTILKKD
jgi:GTP-binding protein LepA